MALDTAQHIRTPVQKANDFTLSYLTSNNGLMPPKKAKEFIKLAIVNAVLLPMTDSQFMREQEEKLNKFGFSDQILHAGTAGVALPSGDRVRPDLSEVSITTQKYMGEVLIEEEVFEDNLGEKRLGAKIKAAIAEKVGPEVELALIKGDTASADPFLAKQDGILKQATSHTVNAGGATLTLPWLKDSKRALPLQYPRDDRKRKFFTSPNAWEDYAEWWEQRVGEEADNHAKNYVAANARGSELIQVPQMPEDYSAPDTSAVLYMDPKNVRVGIHRKMKLRVAPDVRADSVVFVVSMRVGFKFKYEDEVVKLYNVGVTT
jgi:hypothetical protein